MMPFQIGLLVTFAAIFALKLHQNMLLHFGKPTFGHKQTFAKTQLKINYRPSCFEVSHQKLFVLGDMDDYH